MCVLIGTSTYFFLKKEITLRLVCNNSSNDECCTRYHGEITVGTYIRSRTCKRRRLLQCRTFFRQLRFYAGVLFFNITVDETRNPLRQRRRYDITYII